jgi:hypothetical protein
MSSIVRVARRFITMEAMLFRFDLPQTPLFRDSHMGARLHVHSFV